MDVITDHIHIHSQMRVLGLQDKLSLAVGCLVTENILITRNGNCEKSRDSFSRSDDEVKVTVSVSNIVCRRAGFFVHSSQN